MELSEILTAMERNTGTFPRKAIEAAMEMREGIVPELLRIIENTIANAEELAKEDADGHYFAHLYAIYLLAQFRETRAYPLMIQFARLDMDLLYDLVGEFVTEDMCRAIASVCDGDTHLIEDLVEDSNLDGYVRGAALRSLLVLVETGDIDRDNVMAYLKSLLEGKLERSHSHVWDTLVACATRLHPGEVIDHITLAYEEGLVDPGFISPRSVEKALMKDRESVLHDIHELEGGYIENVVDEMAGWACFKNQPKRAARTEPAMPASSQPGPPNPSQPHRTARLKPNDPCVCGSGKKYKKCCGQIT